ncbi:MAG TPA: thioredoxin family protein, partial [Actinobacteria bacterium]|nr:thioredoxin family protein [Actinomycetota bacterium]
YWDKIPVTLVDGQPHDVFFVDAERLRQALTS